VRGTLEGKEQKETEKRKCKKKGVLAFGPGQSQGFRLALPRGEKEKSIGKEFTGEGT